jgi:hypothetical protein
MRLLPFIYAGSFSIVFVGMFDPFFNAIFAA